MLKDCDADAEDGEIAVVHEGRNNFSELQVDLAKVRQDRMLFYALDILFHDGEDLHPKVA